MGHFYNKKGESLPTVPFLKYTIIYKTTIFLFFPVKIVIKDLPFIKKYVANLCIIFEKTNILIRKYHLF